MLETELNNRPDRHPIANVLLILVTVGFMFVFAGYGIGMLIASAFYSGDLLKDMADPASHPDIKMALYIIQACATTFGLIITPFFLVKNTPRPVSFLFRDTRYDVTPILITAFTVVAFMGFNSIFIEWNQNIHLPEPIKWLEEKARTYEDNAIEMTKFLTTFEAPWELMVALIVIAVLPGIGEELVFRGLIQNELFRAWRNPHVAIWVAAFLFSALHLQFFGFVPRLLLGALFGYLYFWSGNILIPMLAHFVNNGMSVIAMYMYQKGHLNYDVEGTESLPVSAFVVSTIITAALLYYFYKYFQTHKPPVQQS